MRLLQKKTNWRVSLIFTLVIGSALGQSYSEGFENLANLTDWYNQNNSVSPDADWGGGSSTVFPAQAGTPNSYLSVNYQSTSSAVGTTISNWLFTPTRTYNNGDVITFYSRTVTGPLYPDRMEVRFSNAGNGLDCGTTATSVGTFTNLLLTINPTLTTTGYPQSWTQYTITISGLTGPTNGRIAFRYFITNAGPGGINSDYIGLDSYTYTSVASPPPNDQCAGAVSLIQGTSCNQTNGTVAYATESQVGCSGTANNDVWYSFTANSTGASISINGSSSFDAVYEVFSGNCANLTSLSCIDAGIEGENESGVLNNLNIGQTYYIRVHDWLDDIPNTLTFGICVQQFIQCALQQPSGSILETESCGADLNGGCNAIPPIYQSLTCGDTVFGSSWATGGNRDLDWYRFTLNSPGNVTLNAQAEFPYYLYLVDISNCSNPIILTSANYNACQNGTVSYNFSTNGSYAAIIVPSLFDGYPCGTFNDYILSINLPPVIAQISASSTNICPNTTTTVSGLTSANYTWYLNGVNFSNGPTAQVSLPGSYTASYTDINGCLSGSNSILLQTLPLDNASFVYPTNTVCVGSGNITPTAQSSGIYSSNSTGLVFDSPTSGEIDITNSIEGNYIITFQTNGACPASSTQSFVITSTPNASFNYSDTIYCQNSTNQLVILGQNASIGIFSSNSNNLNLSASTGEINLTQSEIGTYTIYNTILASGSCPEAIDSFEVQVQGPNVIFPDQGVFCPSSNAAQLTATPIGGNFAGLSIQNNLFNPSLGSCLVTYILTDQNGCIDSASQFITVESPATLIFGQYPELCSNGTSISLDQGLPSGGFYTGNGVSGVSFSPSQGVLGSNILTYHFTSSNGCSDSITGVIVINESPTVTFQPLPTICDTTAALVLGGVAPIGGTFSGIGVIGATFIPSIAGVGMHSITYTYTLNNCSSSATQSITVDQCSSIDELDELLSIFPNPSDGNFTIFGEGITSIKCFTLDGRALSYDIDKIAINELSVQLKEPSGSYVVQIIKSGKSFYFPIIVY